MGPRIPSPHGGCFRTLSADGEMLVAMRRITVRKEHDNRHCNVP
jgi:mannose/cellobiose epimerase-like protein (N-acyl-D-glucosamine 2-epimerase family)